MGLSQDMDAMVFTESHCLTDKELQHNSYVQQLQDKFIMKASVIHKPQKIATTIEEKITQNAYEYMKKLGKICDKIYDVPT